MNYIERPAYMQRLLDLMGTPDIKIITGIRRSGKSELMKAYIRRIEALDANANIVYVDFFDLKYEGLKEYPWKEVPEDLREVLPERYRFPIRKARQAKP